MSTLAVNSITDANAGNTATINGMTPTADSLQGFRNRLINSDMRIDQRNAGASVNLSSTPGYVVDRWGVRLGTSTGSTAQRSTTAPTGFTNSVLLTIGTGATPLATAGTGYFDQTIEGFNIADLGWGAAGAKTITLSFWVRSSLTGSFGVCVTNDGINPSYPTSYTINSADTWEYKTITVPGPTTGTFNTNNAGGIRLFFDWGNGSNFKGTANTWANADYRGGATGTSSICATSGATWYITGVQLEVGSVATPFERRPYGTELALCQRYYETTYPNGTAVGSIDAGPVNFRAMPSGSADYRDYSFKITKRAEPTLTPYNGVTGASGTWRGSSGLDRTITLVARGTHGFYAAGWTLGDFVQQGHWVASAEL